MTRRLKTKNGFENTQAEMEPDQSPKPTPVSEVMLSTYFSVGAAWLNR